MAKQRLYHNQREFHFHLQLWVYYYIFFNKYFCLRVRVRALRTIVYNAPYIYKGNSIEISSNYYWFIHPEILMWQMWWCSDLNVPHNLSEFWIDKRKYYLYFACNNISQCNTLKLLLLYCRGISKDVSPRSLLFSI